ncbi:hypothetical protein GCM10011376_23950 [Nocardioides flavus (ex Wang et al. 2016)]|uniref:DUF222 domain-containing protein n=1 Tax=Nocardioides flavus (ex Wang et al. 2016) TaxID=2058780 RepID=A0ABQ3HLI7_9ACTN|nr:hypothetical protein [Nocardioides flavus (ex Wang et al. 2016)]GHE17785.1 hypothetical protein GCM10011376_23950 [Nocardioides flavus (ex Wang et al. 2016)]
MNRTSHPRRADVLREVTRTADSRLDGQLPMDVDGVAETFGDELTLLGSLQLRWHTRLAGHIERELAGEPLDLGNAVTIAWLRAAEDMPGIRAIIDHHVDHPASAEMARATAIATAKEHELLALMAGRASAPGEAAQRVGREIARAARASYVPGVAPRQVEAPSLVQRLKAVLAA